jgi:quinol monooxygenase YgiN
MLVIAGHIDLDPEKREAAISAAKEIMTETQKETGCISYTFSADLADPGRFLIFEQWQDQEALDAHFATPHMAAFQKVMGGFGIRNMAVQRYEISSVGPLRP